MNPLRVLVALCFALGVGVSRGAHSLPPSEMRRAPDFTRSGVRP